MAATSLNTSLFPASKASVNYEYSYPEARPPSEASHRFVPLSEKKPYPPPIPSLEETVEGLKIKLKSLIKEKEKGFFVPVPRKQITLNLKTAQIYLESGKKLFEEGAEKEAFKQWKEAFRYTNRSEDYQLLPTLLSEKSKTLEAAFAYLNLVTLFFMEDNLDAAHKNMKKALSLLPDESLFEEFRIDYFYRAGEKNGSDYIKLAEAYLEESKRGHAIRSLEKALISVPVGCGLIDRLKDLYQTDYQKVRLYFYAMQTVEKDLVEKYREKALTLASNKLSDFSSNFDFAEFLQPCFPVESRHHYYQAFVSAILEGSAEKTDKCFKRIQEIFPTYEGFEPSQKAHFLTQQQLVVVEQKLARIEVPTSAALPMVAATRSFPKHKVPSLSSASSSRHFVIGKTAWKRHFNLDVGEEPPLPRNIQNILSRMCPFEGATRVKNSHAMVLIPEKVDGKVLTLNSLREIILNPKGEETKSSDSYSKWSNKVRTKLGDAPGGSAHWILIYRGLISETCFCNKSDRIRVTHSYTVPGGHHYVVPTTLEAAAAVIMISASLGTKILGKKQYTYCHDSRADFKGKDVIVGNFTDKGLSIKTTPGFVRPGENRGVCGIIRF